MSHPSRIGLILIVCVTALAACTTLQAPATTLPTGASTPTLQDIISSIDAHLSGLADDHLFTGSVLVAQDGPVLISKGYGLADIENGISNTPQTRFRIGSMTKQFTAMAILLLQAQGKLNVGDRICDYIPDCSAAWGEITIHQLLTHTSGLPVSYPALTEASATQAPLAPIEIIALFKDEPLQFKPGEKFGYSNVGYILLGYLIEEVSGQSYATFLQGHIFGPLNMKDTGYEHDGSNLAIGYAFLDNKADFINISIPFSAGGLYSAVEDLYLWDQALYSEQLVSKESLDTMFNAFVSAPSPYPSQVGYGYGWFVGEGLNRRVIGHGGKINGFKSYIQRFPDDKVTIIVLSNQETSDVFAIATTIAALVFGEE